MASQSSFVLYQSISSALSAWLAEENALANVHHRFMQMLSIRVMESPDEFAAMLEPASEIQDEITLHASALPHFSGDSVAAEKQLKQVFNTLSRTLSLQGVDACAQGLMVLGHALSRCSDQQLNEIGNAAHAIAREHEFTQKYGGRGVTQLKESQLMQLYLAGVTHISIHRKIANDPDLVVKFLKDHGSTEVGRFTPSMNSEGADEGFSLSEQPSSVGDDLIMEFPSKVMDRRLVDALREALNSSDVPSAKAHAFIQALPAGIMKSRDVNSAGIALYICAKELCDQGRQQDSCAVLGYAVHYSDVEFAHYLSKSVSRIALDLETDYTVSRGVTNLAQQLSVKMIDARSVFSRRDACVDELNQSIQNPGLSSNVAVGLISKTLHFTGNDVAAWVAHGMTLLPSQMPEQRRPQAESVRPRL